MSEHRFIHFHACDKLSASPLFFAGVMSMIIAPSILHLHVPVILAELLREPGLVYRLRGGELAEVMFLILTPDAVSPPQQTGSLFSDA